jgi:hypothetical protein
LLYGIIVLRINQITNLNSKTWVSTREGARGEVCPSGFQKLPLLGSLAGALCMKFTLFCYLKTARLSESGNYLIIKMPCKVMFYY